MIDKKQLKDSETFCMLPFMHIYGSAGGNLVPCCEAQEEALNNPGETAQESWNNDNYRELRRALANNERPDRCRVCWHNEDSGIDSNRLQWEKDNWADFADKIEVNDDYSMMTDPLWLELKVSNFCNLKCIMCSTHSSYKRVQDMDIIGKYGAVEETRLLRPTDLFASLNEWPDLWEHVHTLQFTGGEPIINQEHYDLLAGIPAHRKPHIKLRYATNISYIKFKKYNLIDIWSEFKHTNIKVSMDGIGDVYDYIREGAEWDNIYGNMLELNNYRGKIDLAAGITVQAHNIFQMPEFYDFWKESPIDLHFVTANILQTPKYLNPSIWHSRYKDAIIEKLRAAESRHPEMDRFATYMENNTDEKYHLYMRMRKYTRDIENRYKPNITLAEMTQKYLGMPLEDMEQVFAQQEQFGVKK
ncbi:twitch domain-containing radical SAM protein [bacterium]|nr:twitch domain-containing radical SAM protein [bacterium]